MTTFFDNLDRDTATRSDYIEDELPNLVDDYNDDPLESRLWENDASYLVAVSPRIFENNRIRLKIIMGYRVQSVVHGLPSPLDASTHDPFGYDASSYRGYLMPGRYKKYRDGLLDRIDDISPEQFRRLPEHQQRRVLRERYLRRRMQEEEVYRHPLQNGIYDENRGLSSLAYWTLRNFENFGWKSIFGVLAFVFGLYNIVGRR